MYVIVSVIVAALAWYYWPKSAQPTAPIVPLQPSNPIVPVPKAAVTESGKPRWHKFDVLLELQDCLLGAGVEQKKVSEICESIAPLLLGAKK